MRASVGGKETSTSSFSFSYAQDLLQTRHHILCSHVFIFPI